MNKSKAIIASLVLLGLTAIALGDDLRCENGGTVTGVTHKNCGLTWETNPPEFNFCPKGQTTNCCPHGPYSRSCSPCSTKETTMACCCSREGTHWYTSINIATCKDKGDYIWNNDGTLTCCKPNQTGSICP